MKRVLSIGFVLAFLVMGCSYHSAEVETGKSLDDSKINQIVDGETAGSQILVWFGAPSKSTRLGKEELFVYKLHDRQFYPDRYSNWSHRVKRKL